MTQTRIAAALALGLSLSGGMASAEGKLALYNWGDYINPEVLTKFTEETGIEVSLDTYSRTRKCWPRSRPARRDTISSSRRFTCKM